MVVDVTAAVIIDGGCVLLARRSPWKREAGKWEFPGGKREAGETLQESLVRELREEFGVNATVFEELIRKPHEYPHGGINLIAFKTVLHAHPSKSTDHDRIEWVPLEFLSSYELAPADVCIAEYLSTDAKV